MWIYGKEEATHKDQVDKSLHENLNSDAGTTMNISGEDDVQVETRLSDDIDLGGSLDDKTNKGVDVGSETDNVNLDQSPC